METPQEEKCKAIKNIIERLSGVLDIGENTRKKPIPDLKKIYCKLCRTKTEASFQTIADSLRENYNHSSVVACVKEIDALIEVKQFSLIKFYNECEIAVEEFLKIKKKEKTEFYYSLLFTNFLEWQKEEEKLHPDKEIAYFINKYNKINNFS